ncbi:DUF3742 family protein [Escherichia coli]
MSDKTTASRGERWGIKLAHGTKWGIRSVKKLDRYCIGKAKEKGLPAWVGHLPKLTIITTLIIIAFFSLLSFFILFFLYLLSNIITPDALGNNIPQDESDGEYDGYQNGPEGYGYYMGGFKVDD